ncbi:hypothetical protein ACLOJK_015993 [Asimina triloba]
MNTRYFFPPESLSDVSVPVSHSQPSLASEGRSSLPPLSFLMRTVMRISRARWFRFLRRVFHYQNGLRSDLGSNPLNSAAWLALEFVALVVQIAATTLVLAVSRQEKPIWPLRLWLFGYDLGCLLSLPLLYWRYQHPHARSQGNGAVGDIERGNEDSRSWRLMNKSRTYLELFFAMWFVMGNVWIFDARHGTFDQAPKLHVLCITLLAWNAVTYSFPFLLFLFLCCCVPFVSSMLGYNMNMGSVERGASDEQISQLPKWRFKEIDGGDCNPANINENSVSSPSVSERLLV